MKQLFFFSLKEVISLNVFNTPFTVGEKFYGKVWHPFNSIFLYGIGLNFVFYKFEYTVSFMNFFLKFLELISFNRGVFFFFSNLRELTVPIKVFFSILPRRFLFSRFKWVSGLFTNIKVFVPLVHRLKFFFRLKFNQMEYKLLFLRFLIKFSDLSSYRSIPDLAFCADSDSSINFLNECRNLWIPVGGFLTLKAPKSQWLTYPIPFNTTSKEGLVYFLLVIRKTFLKGRLRLKNRFLFKLFFSIKFLSSHFPLIVDPREELSFDYLSFFRLSSVYVSTFLRAVYFLKDDLRQFSRFYRIKFYFFVERSKKYIKFQAFRFKRGRRFRWFRIYKRRRGVAEVFSRFHTTFYIRGFLFGEMAQLVRVFFKKKRQEFLIRKGFVKKKTYKYTRFFKRRRRFKLAFFRFKRRILILVKCPLSLIGNSFYLHKLSSYLLYFGKRFENFCFTHFKRFFARFLLFLGFRKKIFYFLKRHRKLRVRRRKFKKLTFFLKKYSF